MSHGQSVEVGDVRLAYDVRGADDAPPMVLLHALGEDRTDWAPVADRFAERYQVVAVDLRGHGDSERPGTYSTSLMADDVVRLLDRSSLGPVVLVGHSLGGGVSYLVAQSRPDLVARLVIEDAPPLYPRERAVPDRPGGELPFDWAVVPAIVAEINRGDPQMWARLGDITAPSLLVGGGAESHVSQDRLRAAADRIPDATLVTIDAGHLVHATRPDDFADTVLDWLAARA